MKKFIKAIILVFSSIPVLGAAISNPGNLFITVGNNDFPSVLTFAISNILLPLAGTVAMLFIIIGGFQYMTSGGNEEQAESGKKTLTNAIIGLVIVILSYVIVSVVITALNGKA